jgi:hypothetical protein
MSDEFDIAAIEEEAAEAQHDALQRAANLKKQTAAEDGEDTSREDSSQKNSLQQQGNFAEH